MRLARATEPRSPALAARTEPHALDALILDLLEWIGPSARPYDEVLEAWRTSCPRLPVWEDASDRGFIVRRREQGRGTLVSVSAAGQAHLRLHRPARG